MDSPQPRIATLVLCTSAGEVLGELPPFQAEVPWWQDAEGLVRRVRQDHGAAVTILRLLQAAQPEPPGGAVTYLAEVDEEEANRLPLAAWPGTLDQDPLRVSYAEPGGPARDLAWAENALEEHGVRQCGRAEQVRTWNLSSLWRIPAESGWVWLKCVPPFFAHEGAILALLAGRSVPRLLAQQGGRILMPEIPGTDQYDAQPPTLMTLVSMLVAIQAGWVGREDELLGLGLPDWRAAALIEAVESVVRRTAPLLPDDDRQALDHFLESIPHRFASLEECGIPDSLVHGDFAPGNARGDGRRLVLLDWGDCGVGHPLLDQSAFVDRIPPQLVPDVREHWNRQWRNAVPAADPQRAADLLAPVAAARQAVIYQGFLDRIEPSEHPYHRADPARWLRRAAALTRNPASG
jgi:hypothetical protein